MLSFVFKLQITSGVYIHIYHVKNNKLTAWDRILHEKLIVTQLVKKFPPSMEPEVSLLCSQPVTGPYPEPDACNSHPLTIFPKYPL
jgi:hypothetical protein